MNEDTPSNDDFQSATIPEITHLTGSAVELHEMYVSLIWAGFSEKQALTIIGTAVACGFMSPYAERPPGEEPDDDYDDAMD